jgi:hypothetical protein
VSLCMVDLSEAGDGVSGFDEHGLPYVTIYSSLRC